MQLTPLQEVLFQHWLRAHKMDETENPEQFKGTYMMAGGKMLPSGTLQDNSSEMDAQKELMAHQMKLQLEQAKQKTEMVKAHSAHMKHKMDQAKAMMDLHRSKQDFEQSQDEALQNLLMQRMGNAGSTQ